MSSRPAADELRMAAVIGVGLSFNLAFVALAERTSVPVLIAECGFGCEATDGTDWLRWRYLRHRSEVDE